MDARDIPLDDFEQEMLERLLQAHAERSQDLVRAAPQPTAADTGSTRGARRRGRRWRGRLLAAGLITLVAASGAIAAVSILGGSSPPVRLYGGKNLCPGDYAYVAQESTKLVYPPNYPGAQLPRIGQLRCFATAGYARAAGYRLAPVPAGYARVGPIYLAPTPRSVWRTCQRAARVTGATMYCPGWLPTPWIHPAINWDCPTTNCGVPLLSLTGSFTAPYSYAGSASGVGEATVWAATESQRRSFPYLVGCFSAPARLVARTRFREYPAAWYTCSIFGSSTSSMLEWRIGRRSYGITVDGPARVREALVRYVAAHMVPVKSH